MPLIVDSGIDFRSPSLEGVLLLLLVSGVCVCMCVAGSFRGMYLLIQPQGPYSTVNHQGLPVVRLMFQRPGRNSRRAVSHCPVDWGQCHALGDILQVSRKGQVFSSMDEEGIASACAEGSRKAVTQDAQLKAKTHLHQPPPWI